MWLACFGTIKVKDVYLMNQMEKKLFAFRLLMGISYIKYSISNHSVTCTSSTHHFHNKPLKAVNYLVSLYTYRLFSKLWKSRLCSKLTFSLLVIIRVPNKEMVSDFRQKKSIFQCFHNYIREIAFGYETFAFP